MRLRVIVNDASSEPVPAAAGLARLHAQDGVVVEGSADVVMLQIGSARAFVGGDIVGVRQRNGQIAVDAHPEDDLARAVAGGLDAARRSLEGRFAIALIEEDGTCVIGADRFGQQDLYYQQVGTTTVVTTELDLLPVKAQPSPAFDQCALVHALCVYAWRPPKQHTLYQGVRRLGVDQDARIQKGKLEIVEQTFTPLPTGRYGERELEEYATTLLDAVYIRGSREGNVVYLSSGWDSTALLACLVRLFGARRVRALIGRMQYADRSGVINQFELDRAHAVAAYFDVPLQIVEFDYRHRVPEIAEHLRPLMRSHQIAGMTALTHGALAEAAARTRFGDESVFAGEVSDGAHNLGFSQFVTIMHPVLEFREYSDKMASYLFGPTFTGLFQDGRFQADPIYRLFRSMYNAAEFDEPTGAEVPARRRLQILSSFFLRGNRLPLWSLRNSRLLTEDGRAAYTDEMEETYLHRAAEAMTPETHYAWFLHLYNSFHWQGSTVKTMAVTAEDRGLRLALPFWDSRIQDFLSAMPESWGRGLDLNPTKYPLKWMLKHRIDYPLHLQVGPHSYLYDVDPTFSHTAETLYASAWSTVFKAALRRGPYRAMLSPEFFDLAYADAVVQRYLEGTEVRGAELNDLVALAWIADVGAYGLD